jgi:hypothetical protein
MTADRRKSLDPRLVDQFVGRRYVNLESYWGDGRPELTCVQSTECDGILYLRTDPRAGKVGRIRANPSVRVIPCDRNGTPTGAWVEGEARLVEGPELQSAKQILDSKTGPLGSVLVDLMARLKGQRLTALISIRLLRPSGQAGGATGGGHTNS